MEPVPAMISPLIILVIVFVTDCQFGIILKNGFITVIKDEYLNEVALNFELAFP